jgi:cholesterol transport system auxiliary component
MTRSWSRLGRGLAVLVCLAQGACAAALQLARPDPPRLYELTPPSVVAAGWPEVAARLAVEVPTATAGLNVARIALRPTPTTLEYYARASWVDVVPVMVQNLLTEALDQAGGLDVLGRGVVGVRADYALLSHVREFQALYQGPGAPEIRVRIQARLVRLPRRDSVAATSVEAVVQAAGTSMPAIVDAFDEAFGQAAGRLVEWTIARTAATATAGS